MIFATKNFDAYYLLLLNHLLSFGEKRPDRTGVGTFSLFGQQLNFDISTSFPLLTTKKMFWRGIVEELCWMLRGDTNWKTLAEKDVHIWDDWGDKETGELGPVYGKMWTQWPGKGKKTINQLNDLLINMEKDPFSRRHIVTAWNPAYIKDQSLPPCHCFFQFYVHNTTGDKKSLSCKLYMRSCDIFLGLPFNIASYALLTYIIAEKLNMTPNQLSITFGDLHLYENHVEPAKIQLTRKPFDYPTLKILKVTDLDNYTYSDFKLLNYKSHSTIKAPIAV